MNCPICQGVNLVMSERQGIEIDYCPQCRGVWLDRGELDKIIEKSSVAAPPPVAESHPNAYPPPQSHPRQGYQAPQYPHGEHYKKKKRSGFLADLFDFD